ncbi:AN1-type zinc finger protein [Halobacteriaceae archaeon SHR40]|uniref:AN1-type zinc finger domain-containing protein n=1 Tax=Halovenus amylolytica TaxID=2500550 RepID=UPI000FE32E19
MTACNICGADDNFNFECSRCGGHFCGDHRHPENHDCDGGFVGEYNTDKDRGPEPMKVQTRTASTPDSDFGNSSPDVAPDGSIKREENSEQEEAEIDDSIFTRFYRYIRFW